MASESNFVNRSSFLGPVASPPNLFLLNFFSASISLFSSFFFLTSLFVCPPVGGNRRNWTNFEAPSFLAILRDPAGCPPSSRSFGRRRAGTKLHRLFTNTLWSAGTSKRLGLEAACFRALLSFAFSSGRTLFSCKSFVRQLASYLLTPLDHIVFNTQQK